MVISRIALSHVTKNTTIIIKPLLPSLSGYSIHHAESSSRASLEISKQFGSQFRQFSKRKRSKRKDTWSEQEREATPLEAVAVALSPGMRNEEIGTQKNQAAINGKEITQSNPTILQKATESNGNPQRVPKLVKHWNYTEAVQPNSNRNPQNMPKLAEDLSSSETVQASFNRNPQKIPKLAEDWSSSEAVQAMPLHGFYKLMLEGTPEYVNPVPIGLRMQEQEQTQASSSSNVRNGSFPPRNSTPPTPPRKVEPVPSESKSTVFPTVAKPQPKAAITFSSRLTSPTESRRDEALKSSKSEVIAGVVVPRKPAEPDNCCMSGCVNCVWDLYREDLEFHMHQKRLAMEALAKLGQSPKREGTIAGRTERIPISTSMEDDGGGSIMDEEKLKEETWLENDEIPVGIRVFMATEKKLKEQKLRGKELATDVMQSDDRSSNPQFKVIDVP